MFNKTTLGIFILSVLVTALLIGVVSDRVGLRSKEPGSVMPEDTGSGKTTWLKGDVDEKFAQIEKHLRGLDVAMAEIGYRYGELYFAAREQNWEYADYQTEKISLAMELALERRPKRLEASRAFIEKDLPDLKAAISSRNIDRLRSSLDRLHNSCIDCHRAENVLHFRDAVERIRKNALK